MQKLKVKPRPKQKAQPKPKKNNIVWHVGDIEVEQREKRYKHKSAIVWLSGLSGAGKSSIAVELEKILFKDKRHVYILDGDNIRHGLNKNLGFSAKDREENIRRVSEVARLFADAGFIIITAFISPYKKDRDRAREMVKRGKFIEVFVKASLNTCEKRDTKGLYKKARAGIIPQFTGISDPYEKPEKAELVVNTEKESVHQSAIRIYSYLKENQYLS